MCPLSLKAPVRSVSADTAEDRQTAAHTRPLLSDKNCPADAVQLGTARRDLGCG